MSVSRACALLRRVSPAGFVQFRRWTGRLFLAGFSAGLGIRVSFQFAVGWLVCSLKGNGALVEVTGCQGNAAQCHLDGLVAEKGLAPPETDSRLNQEESTAVPQDMRHPIGGINEAVLLPPGSIFD